jgi:hypothetical protein
LILRVIFFLNYLINLQKIKTNYIYTYKFEVFVIPPNEYNSIFVMTNYIETYQREGKCDEVMNGSFQN